MILKLRVQEQNPILQQIEVILHIKTTIWNKLKIDIFKTEENTMGEHMDKGCHEKRYGEG